MRIIRYNNAYVTGYDWRNKFILFSFNKPEAVKFDSKGDAIRWIVQHAPRKNYGHINLTIQKIS